MNKKISYIPLSVLFSVIFLFFGIETNAQPSLEIWFDAVGADNIIAVHIRHIREKIEINPKEPRYLKVVWGQGYKVEKR